VDLIEQIQDALSPDLLKKGYETEHRLGGHCYVASEALWHITEKCLHVYRARDDFGVVHWWLENDEGVIYDCTAQQYTDLGRTPPYTKGRRSGFLTKEPSKRAKELIKRIMPD
jgi:hypothetical protein